MPFKECRRQGKHSEGFFGTPWLQLVWDPNIKFSSDCTDCIVKNVQAEFRAAFQMVHRRHNFWGF